MNWKRSIVCLLLLLFVTETALAWPRLFRRRRRPQQAYSSAGYRQTYDDQYAQLPASSAVYDWEALAKADASDYIPDYIPIVLTEPISGELEVKLTCLNHSTVTHTIKTQLKDGRAEVRHESIRPGTMYRLCAAFEGKERIAGPYFAATSGDSRQARGRRAIIVRYFEQYWRKENGWSYHNTNCDAGYRWAIQPYAAHPYYYHNGYHLAGLDQEGMIHGDRCANAAHAWMALAYDEDTGNIWCIDSNYGSTIMVVVRQPSGCSVGHLTEDHFYEE
jgi:hypothetical protein